MLSTTLPYAFNACIADIRPCPVASITDWIKSSLGSASTLPSAVAAVAAVAAGFDVVGAGIVGIIVVVDVVVVVVCKLSN